MLRVINPPWSNNLEMAREGERKSQHRRRLADRRMRRASAPRDLRTYQLNLPIGLWAAIV